LVVILGAVLAVVVLGGLVGVALTRSGPSQRTITATFAETPGLYPGNHVDVLDMPVGKITAIHPTGTGVNVVMQVPASLKIPAGAQAILEAPQVVNDRYVQLQPVYRGGPVMADHATIPVERTSTPLSTDQIFRSLDGLLTSLGPTAGDTKGALGSLITTLNAQLGGQGTNLHNTLQSTSQAVSALAADSPQLAATLNNLSSFVTTLAANAGTYQSFADNLNGAASELNADRTSLASALSGLQQTLAQVTAFIRANGGNLKGAMDNLQTATAVVAQNQAALAQGIHLLPLAAQNTVNAIRSGPQGTAIYARFDPMPAAKLFTDAICGSSAAQGYRTARTVYYGVGQPHSQDTTMDDICLGGESVASYSIPPGQATGPDMSLQAVFAGGHP
ncbi:MAG: MCE family protein, partial [Acidimicrobiales bacterium]